LTRERTDWNYSKVGCSRKKSGSRAIPGKSPSHSGNAIEQKGDRMATTTGEKHHSPPCFHDFGVEWAGKRWATPADKSTRWSGELIFRELHWSVGARRHQALIIRL